MKKIFDLYDTEKYNFSNDINQNILLLQKLFTKKFNIKYNSTILPVKLSIDDIKKNVFSLTYDDDNKLDIIPFKIIFIDIITFEINNNSFISDLNKYENITLKKMLKIIILLNKILNVKKIYIYDGNKNYLDLLLNNKTFYMDQGFIFSLIPFNDSNKFKSTHEKYNYIMNIINKCKKITIKEIILFFKKLLLLSKQNYNKKFIIYYKELNKYYDIFKNINEKYLYEFMINNNNKRKNNEIYLYLITDFSFLFQKNIKLNNNIFINLKHLFKYSHTYFEYNIFY